MLVCQISNLIPNLEINNKHPLYMKDMYPEFDMTPDD